MAARTNKIRHDQETRTKIRVSQLLNRLENHALGLCEMTSTQVRAAEVALRKCLPDLSMVEHAGDVTQTYVIRAPATAANMDEWRKQHDPQQTLQ